MTNFNNLSSVKRGIITSSNIIRALIARLGCEAPGYLIPHEPQLLQFAQAMREPPTAPVHADLKREHRIGFWR